LKSNNLIKGAEAIRGKVDFPLVAVGFDREICLSIAIIEALKTVRKRNVSSKSQTIKSLAILPLTNAGSDEHTEYLSDGITESIINSLSGVPQLHVMARSSVSSYKGREVDPKQAGRELNVETVGLVRAIAPTSEF
jgi:TolB-like protein